MQNSFYCLLLTICYQENLQRFSPCSISIRQTLILSGFNIPSAVRIHKVTWYECIIYNVIDPQLCPLAWVNGEKLNNWQQPRNFDKSYCFFIRKIFHENIWANYFLPFTLSLICIFKKWSLSHYILPSWFWPFDNFPNLNKSAFDFGLSK